ncbi:MAG: hypothetical protein WC655_24755, partial [Candidatus Hydrogenedentales bacterium]
MAAISCVDLARLNKRVEVLARDKANTQLVMHLIESLAEVQGLDMTVERMLQAVLEHVGGTNLAVFYTIDSEIHYADVLGARKQISVLDDPLVKHVFESHVFMESEHDFSDTRMLTTEFTKASTWVFPLLVGQDLIGIFKIESTHFPAAEILSCLPTFFSYAALSLKNEINGYAKLKKAYDNLRAEVAVRKKAETELLEAKTLLEERVAERTADLQRVNRLYDVLSRVNQAIVRIDSREDLFSEVCQIMV